MWEGGETHFRNAFVNKPMSPSASGKEVIIKTEI